MTYIRIVFSALLAAPLSGNAGASEAPAEAESLYLAPIANDSLRKWSWPPSSTRRRPALRRA